MARATGPQHPAEIERVPLEDRGLPESTYHALVRAAELWPERPAISCLPDAERWQRARDAHVRRARRRRPPGGVRARRAGRRRAATPSAILSVNCAEMVTALLAAEAVGIAAPINPALAAEHAAELVRLSGARVIVAAGPRARPARVGARAHGSRAETGARALLALRPTAPRGRGRRRSSRSAGPTVAYLASAWPRADADGAAGAAPRGERPRELPAHRRHDRHAEARRAHARQRGRQRLDDRLRRTSMRPGSAVFAALPLFHTNALRRHRARRRCSRASTSSGRARSATATSRCSATSGSSSSATASRSMSGGADRLRRARAGARRRRHLAASQLPIVGAAPLPPRSRDAFEAAHRRRAVRGLRADRGHVRQRAQLRPARSAPGTVGQRLPYQEVRAVAIDEATGDVDVPAGRRGRDARPARARTSSPATSCRGPRSATRAARGRQGPRRLARHRRPRLRRRRRLRPPRRPRQGPDHPRRPQHRPGDDRGRAARAPGGRRRRRRRPARRARRRGAGRVRHARRRAPRSPPTSCGPGRPSACPSAPPRRGTSRSSTRSRSPPSASRSSPSCGAGPPRPPRATRSPGSGAGVTARLAGGRVVVTVRGGDIAAVRDALAPFAFEWENTEEEAAR